MSDTNEILQKLVDEVRDVRNAFIASRDGFLIDGVTTNNNIDLEALSAFVIPKIDEMSDLAQDFSLGDWDISMIEFENGTVITAFIEEDTILVVSARGKRSVGSLRIKIKKLIKDLLKVL